ncbi:MAG: hypothetical protein JSV08_04485 [Acidobacteriota bacterium]|nr:MAG: hypothetical protein JSV08_04485 [Acidobacteriota bacterium]
MRLPKAGLQGRISSRFLARRSKEVLLGSLQEGRKKVPGQEREGPLPQNGKRQARQEAGEQEIQEEGRLERVHAGVSPEEKIAGINSPKK